MRTKTLNIKKIAYIHDVEIEVDARAQKEIVALKNNGAKLLICAWNKNMTSKNIVTETIIRGETITIENICEKVKKSQGMRENFIPLIRYQFKLFVWLIRNIKRIDYVHSVDLDTAFLTSIVCKIFNKKMIYDIFDDYADCHAKNKTRLHTIIKKIDKGIIKRSDVVIICSEKRKEQLATKPKKMVIIHNSPDISPSSNKKYNVCKRTINIAYVGNLFPGRMTIEMAKIIAKDKRFSLYCGGAGLYEKELTELSKTNENIHFYGRMLYEDVVDLEEECDIIPALYDPNFANHKYAAPNKFYEALALGKPTIMVKNTGMDEIVASINSGIVIEYTEKSLEEALESILCHIDYWRNRKDDLKKYYKEHYSWNIMEKRLIDLYREF